MRLLLSLRPALKMLLLCGMAIGTSLLGNSVAFSQESSTSKPDGQATDNSPGDPAADKIDFETQILPLLKAKCFDCHGPETQESRFRLDRRAALLRGGDSGEPGIIPGKAQESHLIQLVKGEGSGKFMPPEEADRLNADQVQLLTDWINQGAPWSANSVEEDEGHKASDHWSFRPVLSPPIPESKSGDQAAWGQNPVDAFILQGLQQHQLSPNPRASKTDLIRRLYLDMLGLPPTPEEVRAFVNDNADDAWPRLVEKVLASPHYGERWARYWLDLVRFAETNGFETNRERPNAWPYRDYVIRSLNEDKPYNQFLREQIAGDAIGVPEATAYLVAGPYDLVKSPDINLTLMQRQNELDDIVNTTGTAFLGLTLGCARCHNHKFDPVRQSDYYALQGIFAGVQHGDRAMPRSEAAEKELATLDAKLVVLRDQLRPFIKTGSPARPAVNVRGNEEVFAATEARYVRFTIEESSGGEPCIDELEIYSNGRNVALSSDGAKATCSSTLPGYAIHKLEHINDGLSGNAHSWISNEPGKGWIQIELPQTFSVSRIVWARDRDGQFGDRLATKYRIEVSLDGQAWAKVSSSEDRAPFSAAAREPEYVFDGQPEENASQGKAWLAELRSLESRRSALVASASVYAGTFQQPGPVYRLFRGEPSAPREQVKPNTVAALGALPIDDSTPEQQRRLALAEWIASKDNPLTARVIVNRLWQFHFGRGFVSTPSDFGAAGVKPTHPELLDWLSDQLMSHGWSLKHVHRLILLSATYQQSGEPNEAAMKIDAGTEWWWRFPARRLEAEPMRDSILAVTGVLDSRMYGPGFSAFEVELENVRHYFPKKSYGPEDFRRMIYQTKVRLEKESVFGAFDCPDAATSVPRRSRSTTPLQALNLLNSPFMLQQSELFAARLRKEAETPEAQVKQAWWLCFGRPPESGELSESLAFISEEGLEAFCRAVLNSNEFVFIP